MRKGWGAVGEGAKGERKERIALRGTALLWGKRRGRLLAGGLASWVHGGEEGREAPDRWLYWGVNQPSPAWSEGDGPGRGHPALRLVLNTGLASWAFQHERCRLGPGPFSLTFLTQNVCALLLAGAAKWGTGQDPRRWPLPLPCAHLPENQGR